MLLAAFLLGSWEKHLVGRLTTHVDISLGTDRSPREGPAQSERGMDSQKPSGEDKDSEPAGEWGKFWVCWQFLLFPGTLISGLGTRT